MKDRGRWGAGALAYALACAGIVGCGGTSGDHPPDTSEVTPTPEWTADLELRIGSLDDPDYSLTAIRGLEVGPDGSIYTLHPSEAIIRRFDSEGTILRTIGGRGGGPGEFRSASLMGMVADTLWVMDTRGSRISLFRLDGTYVNSFSVPFDMGSPDMSEIPPRAQGLLFDGTVYGQSPGFSNWLADGRLRDQVPVLMNRDGVVTDTLPAMPYRNLVWALPNPDGRGGGSYSIQPFGDRTAFGFDLNERALIALDRPAPQSVEEASFTVMKLDFSGDTLFSRRFDFEPIPIRQEEIDSVLDARAAAIAERGVFGLSELEARRGLEATLYAPAFRPGARYAVPGLDGSIWIAEEPGDADTATWLVIDTDGEPLGRVTLPANVSVRQADFPLLWGVETDELDVPYIVRYRVTSSMIAMVGAAGTATLAASRRVTRPTPQASRRRDGVPLLALEVDS